VRPAKARGKDKDLPTCAEWPHNVRPPGFYLGAFMPPGSGKPGAPGGKGKVIGEDDPLVQHLSGAASVLRNLYGHFLLYMGIMSPLEKGPDGFPTEATFREWLRGEIRRVGDGKISLLADPANRCEFDADALTVTLLFASPFGPRGTCSERDASLQTCPQLFAELRVGIRHPVSTNGDDAGFRARAAKVVRGWYRELSLRFHPDRGGSDERQLALNVAQDRLKELLGID
jgi:hypothetical protein